MQNLQEILKSHTQKAVNEIFNTALDSIELQQTKKEFQGDVTIVNLNFDAKSDFARY